MEITLLGTGSSQGVPRPSCDCVNCQQIKPGSKSYRRRAGILIKAGEKIILIDASPDLRDHMLTYNIKPKDIDAILITHTHYDHYVGLPEFCYMGKKKIVPVYTTKENFEYIKKVYAYLFPKKLLDQPIEIGQTFTIGTIEITPLELNHKPYDCLGFKIVHNNKTLIVATDTRITVPERTKEAIKEADLVIFDCWAENEEKFKEHVKKVLPDVAYDHNLRNHSTLEEVQELAKQLKFKKVVITHIGCQSDLHENMVEKYQTESFIIGYDGLKLTL